MKGGVKAFAHEDRSVKRLYLTRLCSLQKQKKAQVPGWVVGVILTIIAIVVMVGIMYYSVYQNMIPPS